MNKRAQISLSIGIDVSKSGLNVHVLPGERRLRVPNTPHGLSQLKRWLKRFDVAVVVVEATGKWHRFVRRSLFAAGLPVAVVDPYRVRAFARVQGLFHQNQSARRPGAGAVQTGDERRG